MVVRPPHFLLFGHEPILPVGDAPAPRLPYLGHLFAKYGNERLALAAYNAGQDNVDRWQREHVGIRFDETKDYVAKVERLKKIYRRAYASQLGYE